MAHSYVGSSQARTWRGALSRKMRARRAREGRTRCGHTARWEAFRPQAPTTTSLTDDGPAPQPRLTSASETRKPSCMPSECLRVSVLHTAAELRTLSSESLFPASWYQAPCPFPTVWNLTNHPVGELRTVERALRIRRRACPVPTDICASVWGRDAYSGRHVQYI